MDTFFYALLMNPMSSNRQMGRGLRDMGSICSKMLKGHVPRLLHKAFLQLTGDTGA